MAAGTIWPPPARACWALTGSFPSPARQLIPEGIGLQGNLDPALLAEATPEKVGAETRRVLEEMRGRNGHIFNLGHGVTPAAKLENIAALVQTVNNFQR